MREAALSELGSAPRLGVDSCVGGPETRSTAGMRDCLNSTDYSQFSPGGRVMPNVSAPRSLSRMS